MTTETTYTFNELSDKAKERALQDWQFDWDLFDSECLIDDAKREGVERGFDIEDVRWSGFYTQGDGASWQGRIKIGTFIDYHLKEDNPDHHRYIVLRELIRDDWAYPDATVYYSGTWYTNSAHMKVEYYEATDFSETRSDAVITDPESVLCGASVRELANGISMSHLLDNLAEWMQDKARSYADEIYSTLRKEYDHYISAENFAEIAEINDWRFDEDGKMI